MLDRFEPLLKIICLALAALLLLEIVQRIVHTDPLGSASVPPLPKLAVEKPPTNSPVKVEGTNASTNSIVKQKSADTNTVAQLDSGGKGTNSVAKARRPKRPPGMGMPFGGPPMAVNLPPAVQTRVDRVKESEILGPFMRPPPMALLGIADDDAFLRGPDGQTGLVKEGGELGGIKVLRIGINRVLIEQDGEKKELTLFNGFGSESFLPKETDSHTNASTMPNKKENP